MKFADNPLQSLEATHAMVSRAKIISVRRFCAAALLYGLSMTTALQAGPIDPEHVSVEYGQAGMKVVRRDPGPSVLLQFAPFGLAQQRVPGFSDPLGAGSHGPVRLLSGTVQHMELLGDFHPSNPFDPQELEPTSTSLQADQMVNTLLYRLPLPASKDLLNTQLNIKKVARSSFSETPKTRETSPLVLSGYGTVSELSLPVQLHWTLCADYSVKRMLFEASKKAPAPVRNKSKPRVDCFVI